MAWPLKQKKCGFSKPLETNNSLKGIKKMLLDISAEMDNGTANATAEDMDLNCGVIKWTLFQVLIEEEQFNMLNGL